MTPFRVTRLFALFVIASALSLVAARVGAANAPAPFALHDGDRVVFYGDSITQDGGYGCFVEEYCRTRFPGLNLRFYNGGVGGDTVRGGGAGGIDERLERDVIRLKPTVVTIMLGLNDGRYRKLEPATLEAFIQGYRSIVERIKKELPGVRIYLIRSSPFDDVARAPNFEPGYMDVLRQMGDAVALIARDEQASVVDFGGVVADGIRLAVRNNPGRAHHLLPDRVHPSPAGHLIMGAALLRAFGATPLVSRVVIDAKGVGVESADNATVASLKSEGGLVSWTETDGALPLPLNFQEANVELAQVAGADLESLDSEELVVAGLPPGRYTVHIDDRTVGPLSDAELARGVNLAVYDTPMRWQAYQTVWASESGRDAQRLERQLRHNAGGDPGAKATADFLLQKDEADQATRSKVAKPLERHFSVAPAP